MYLVFCHVLSKQTLKNDVIDFDHQKALLSHFFTLKEKQATQGIEINLNEKQEVKLLVKLVKDVIDGKNKLIFRKCIGGVKIFYAYSFKCQDWQIGIYELEKQGDPPLNDLQPMDFISKLLNDKMNQHD